MKNSVVLVILCICAVSCSYIQKKKVQTYGDIANYDWLGVEMATAHADPFAARIESVTFPEVSNYFEKCSNFKNDLRRIAF